MRVYRHEGHGRSRDHMAVGGADHRVTEGIGANTDPGNPQLDVDLVVDSGREQVFALSGTGHLARAVLGEHPVVAEALREHPLGAEALHPGEPAPVVDQAGGIGVGMAEPYPGHRSDARVRSHRKRWGVIRIHPALLAIRSGSGSDRAPARPYGTFLTSTTMLSYACYQSFSC